MAYPSPRFTLDDINRRNVTYLNVFLNFRVSECFVEFLRQPGVTMPHVVFRLNTNQRVEYLGTVYCGCRLSMEYMGEPGELIVRLLEYPDPSWRATVSFQFPVLTRYTVDDWLRILRGVSWICTPAERTNLTRFRFVLANAATQEVAGCRDFIAQCMIRLNTLRVVGWSFERQVVPNIELVNSYYGFDLGTDFHDIIGNDYSYEDDEMPVRQYPRALHPVRCFITPLLIYRGEFLDQRVRRIEAYGRYRIPYRLT